jgi:L-arabinose isomerase
MKQNKPKIGILLIGSRRFRRLGEGCKSGTYEERRGRFGDELIEQLGETAECAFPGVAYEREDMDNAILFFMKEKVDCVICSFLSWSEDSAWIAFLRDMYDIPLALYLSTLDKMPYKDTRNEDDFIEFLAQGGLVGSLEGSGSIPRLGREIEVIVGDFAAAKDRLENFASASAAKARLRRARFGLLPVYNRVMWSTYVDPYKMFSRIGPELEFISYAGLKAATDKISDAEADAYVKELTSLYQVEADVDSNLFRESARASLALGALRDKFDLDALVLNDVDHELFHTMGLRPGFYPPSFNANNAILVPEGDLGAGTIVYALKQLTGKHISFVEPFYIEKASNTFSAGHAGPHDYTDERYRDQVRISRDVRFAKTSFKYAGAPFAWYRIPTGPKTLAHFSETDGNFKIVCFIAEALPGEHALCSYSHGDFRPKAPVTELFEKIIKIGTTQHFAVVEGDVREKLAMFAKINNFDFYAF